MSTLKKIWRNYVTNGEPEADVSARRRVEFVLSFTLVGLPTFLLFGYLNVVSGEVAAGLIELAIAVIVVLNVAALRLTKRTDIAASVMLVVVLFALLFLLFDGGISNTGPFWFAIFPALAFFLKDKREGVIWVSVLYFGILAVVAADELGIAASPFTFDVLRQLLASYVVISVLLYLYADSNERGEATIAIRDHDLREANRALSREVNRRKRRESELQDAVAKLDAKNRALDEEREKFQFQVWETKKFAEAAAFSEDGIIITTPEGVIVYVNPAWQKMTGYSFDEVLGATPALLKSGATPESVYEKMWAALGRGESFRSEDLFVKINVPCST